MAQGIFRRSPQVKRPPRKLPAALFPAAPVAAPPLHRRAAPAWLFRKRRIPKRPSRKLSAALLGSVPAPRPLARRRVRLALFRKPPRRPRVARRLAPQLFPAVAPPAALFRRKTRPALRLLRPRRRRAPPRRFLSAALLPAAPAAGVASGWVYHYSGVLIPDSAVLAAADTGFAIFDTFVWNPVAQGIYEAPGFTMTKEALVRAYATVQAQLGPGTTGKVNPILQIRYSQSASQDPAMWTADGNPMWAADPNTPMWSGLSPWQNWTKGQLQTTFVQLRVVFNFADGLPILQQFVPVVDQPTLTDSGKGVTVAPGGTPVAFNNVNFLNAPVVHPSLVSVNGDTTGFAQAGAVSATGFTAFVFDHTGADVGGVIDWTAST